MWNKQSSLEALIRRESEAAEELLKVCVKGRQSLHLSPRDRLQAACEIEAAQFRWKAASDACSKALWDRIVVEPN